MFIVPQRMQQVVRYIQDQGGAIYFVGGCVRDWLLGRPVRDFDLVTDLLPERIREIFPQSFCFTSHQETVVLKEQEVSIEISSLQGKKIDENLLERDFTINSLAWCPSADRVLDPTGGKKDLWEKKIRSVNFGEAVRADPLRMMRAARFYAELDFSLEAEITTVTKREATLIQQVAVERIREELYRILVSANSKQGFSYLWETGLLAEILPELACCFGLEQNDYHADDVFYHTLTVVEAMPAQKKLRVVGLLHDLGKAVTKTCDAQGVVHFYGHDQASVVLARQILARLKMFDLDVTAILTLIANHMYDYVPETTDKALRRLLQRLGREQLMDFLLLRQADLLGTGRYDSLDLRQHEQFAQRMRAIAAENSALEEKELAWSRADRQRFMQEHGIIGRQMGEIKQKLLAEVLENPALNQRESILQLAEFFFKLR